MTSSPAHEVPAHLIDPEATILHLHPVSSEENIPNTFLSTHSTMTTSSGALVTTVTSQSRRHSSVLPHQMVSPSRRQSSYDLVYPCPIIQSINQQILALQVSVGCIEKSTNEWQSDSSHALEVQLEKFATNERAMLENQLKIYELEKKLNSRLVLEAAGSDHATHYQHGGYFLLLLSTAVGGFMIGRFLK